MRIFTLVIFLCLHISLLGQEEVDTSSTSRVEVVNSESFEFRGDLDPPEQHFKGNVKMQHDSIFMFCDTAKVTETILIAKGNIAIIQSDTIHLFADSMIYDSKLKVAQLFNEVVLENGKQQIFTDRLDYYLDTKIAIIPDTAILQNNRTKLSALRAKYDVNADLATFTKEVVVIDDDFKLYTDSLQYNTKIDKAIFVDRTRITQDEKIINCSSGYYLIPNGIAEFGGNPDYTEGTKTAKADLMRYNRRDGTITLIGNADYKDEGQHAIADKIIYDEKTGDIQLEGNAWFKDKESEAQGDIIYYNEKSEKVSIEGSAFLTSEESDLNAASVQFDELTGLANFIGNAKWFNKKDSTSIFAHQIKANDKEKEYEAIGDSIRPYMIRDMDSDSLFLSADTLFVSEQIDSLDTINVFKAYKDVRILSKEFQAKSDSLYYDSRDSIFTLFQDPILWSDQSQFTGDTIKLYLNEDGLYKIDLIKNSLILEYVVGDYYNQIKSKYLTAFIDSSEIKTMHMNGNAESNYFIKDDEEAFVGMNHTLCKEMDFYFETGELSDIKFYFRPTSLLTPMVQLQSDKLYLEGFDWKEDIKPMVLEDLLVRKQMIESIPLPDLKSEKESSVPETEIKNEEATEESKKDKSN